MSKFSNYIHVVGAPATSSTNCVGNDSVNVSSNLDVTEPTSISNYTLRLHLLRDKRAMFKVLFVACPDDVWTAMSTDDFFDSDNIEYYKQFIFLHHTGFVGDDGADRSLFRTIVELSSPRKFDLREGDTIGWILCVRDVTNNTNAISDVHQSEYDIANA